MWSWESVPITPTGPGICGGEIIYMESASVCRNVSSLIPELIIQPSFRSNSSNVSRLDITGYGSRELVSICSNISSMDIGRGLTVFNGSEIVSFNTNTLRFDGELIAATDTINKVNDASIFSPAVVEVDGGDVNSDFETLDGGGANENP